MATASEGAAPDRRSPLERALALFTEVRAGEGPTALLLALELFVLLSTYYLIKPVREALILAGGGAELKSYTAAAQTLLLAGLVPLYAAVASRVPRRVLIDGVTVVFAACMVGFYALARLEVPYLGVAFFVWVGIFNLMVIAQLWSLANDVYTPEQGKRLFPLVGFGASLGAVFGSLGAGRLIARIGTYETLLVAAGMLIGTLVLTGLVDRRGSGALDPDPRDGAPAEEPEATTSSAQAFRLVLRDRYLTGIAMLALLLNAVNTTGEYILGKVVLADVQARVAAGAAGGLEAKDLIGVFYADFFLVVNLVALVAQLFLVSRVIRFLGVRTALLVLPLIAMGGYLLLAVAPVLAFVRWAKTAENATDYSLQNTVRNLLFLPTSRAEKYQAKQAIDTFFWRGGDLLSAAMVLLGTSLLVRPGLLAEPLGPRAFAAVNVVLVSAWLVLAFALGRAFEARTRRAP